MGTQETILGVIADRLLDIDATLKELLALSKSKRAATPAAPSNIATDADLDGQYGDPVVKFTPRDWTGDDCKGILFSDCPPDFLDALAKAFDYFAQKKQAENDPKAKYEVLNAARARGWAARLRSGWTPPRANPEWQEGEPKQW